MLDVCRWRFPLLARACVRVDGMISSTLALSLTVSVRWRVLPLLVAATFGFAELCVNAADSAWSRGVVDMWREGGDEVRLEVPAGGG
jgi:hypothetical protein